MHAPNDRKNSATLALTRTHTQSHITHNRYKVTLSFVLTHIRLNQQIFCCGSGGHAHHCLIVRCFDLEGKRAHWIGNGSLSFDAQSAPISVWLDLKIYRKCVFVAYSKRCLTNVHIAFDFFLSRWFGLYFFHTSQLRAFFYACNFRRLNKIGTSHSLKQKHTTTN